mgnify:CR=1 FL=1
MTVVDILYTILIGPLQLVFEIIYTIANRFIGHPGLAIIVLSLIMNFLVLPLYKRSDAMQEEARDVDAKLKKGVDHIKSTFSGDERMMILQTYYRQNNYKPTDALNGSVSLLLQVPFFMAAYNFLSSLQEIQGVSLGPITDLGAPDAMFQIGGFDINMLPIIMTLVNVISSAIYLKGFPLKQKLQIYGMALFFLVFLYTSPAGLVFYWTLNNVFSLVKTIFYKLKNPQKVLVITATALGVLAICFGLFVYDTPSIKRKLLVVSIGVILQLPLLWALFKNKLPIREKNIKVKNNKKVFIIGVLFLAVLVGALIPSTLIASSPQEFVDITFFHHPLWYVAYSMCLSVGTFLVWFGVFYWIANPVGKVIMEKLIWIMCGVMMVNYLFFGTDLGIMSANLTFENGVSFGMSQILQNMLVLLLVVVIAYVLIAKWQDVVQGVLLSCTIAIIGMSAFNVYNIQADVAILNENKDTFSNGTPHFSLSKNGKNVVVIMLDRALGYYIPYFMQENPELEKQFDGFTYYSNVISHGGFTNFGTPGLFGGYEYTPIEMNKRTEESLVSKHNEALKVLPVMFSENNYEVTVCDATYANYQWVPDMSIYDEYPEIDTYITEGKFSDPTSKEYQIAINKRNFFCYSIMKTMPLLLQEHIYECGNYNMAKVNTGDSLVYSSQVLSNNYVAEGVSGGFMNPYYVLVNLPNMTNVVDGESNTFMMMTNNMTHEPMLLQEPYYEPALNVDNTEFSNNTEKYTWNERTLRMESSVHFTHYQSNMSAMLQLGRWFDYLRENDVYDNTRIILVSDHGRTLYQLKELTYDRELEDAGDLALFNPLLMVKDFNEEGFTISDEFMTNADVPTLAVDQVIENPTNPFTGKMINNTEKTAHAQYITTSLEWDVETNNGNTFIASQWYSVKDNIWDLNNWNFIEEECTIPTEVQEDK